jgi:hypothetical protein
VMSWATSHHKMIKTARSRTACGATLADHQPQDDMRVYLWLG